MKILSKTHEGGGHRSNFWHHITTRALTSAKTYHQLALPTTYFFWANNAATLKAACGKRRRPWQVIITRRWEGRDNDLSTLADRFLSTEKRHHTCHESTEEQCHVTNLPKELRCIQLLLPPQRGVNSSWRHPKELEDLHVFLCKGVQTDWFTMQSRTHSIRLWEVWQKWYYCHACDQ